MSWAFRRIRTSYKDGTANALLESFHKILAKSIARLKENTDDSMLYFKSFTDNVVLAHPRFSDDMESEFGFTLWSIREYQFQMALKGFSFEGWRLTSCSWMETACTAWRC